MPTSLHLPAAVTEGATRSASRDDPRKELIGRGQAQQTLLALLESVETGMSAAVAVRGEVGVGKTTLLEYVAARVSPPAEVMLLSGLEAETHLEFAGIHRLCVRYLDRVEALPPAQAEALQVALGLKAGHPASTFLLGLAVLALLADLTAARPLIIVIDDAQWLDAESLQILAFVARRVYAEKLGLFFGVREPVVEPILEGIPDLEIARLAPDDATDLVVSLSSGPIDRQVAGRIAVKAAGNPLVITEACRELNAGRVESGLLLDDPLPIGQRLESHYRRHITTLPADCQALLVYLAAVPTPDFQLVQRVARHDGLDPDAIQAAVTIGLIEPHPSLRFRHPLIRSAVYTGAAEADRRHAHSVLAETLDAEADAHLRAWHLAAAATGPSEPVALGLERSATSARDRGGFLAEAAYLARAGDLSSEPGARASRMISAAEAALTGGAPAKAQELLETILPHVTDPHLKARARKLQANALHRVGGAGQRNPATLVEAAEVFAKTRPDLASDTMLEALEQTFVRAQLISDTTPAEVGRAALALRTDDGATLANLLLESVGTHLSEGFVAAAPLLREALAALAAEDALRAEVPRWFALGLFVAQLMWDAQAAKDWLKRCDQVARRTGALDLSLMTLVPLAGVHAALGEPEQAEASLNDFRQLSRAAGTPESVIEKVQNVRLLAVQGLDNEARGAAERAIEFGARIGAGNHQRLGNLALLQIAIGRSQYAEAFALANAISAQDNVGMENESLPTLVEAALRSGHRDEARRALHRLRERATASGTDWALGLLLRCEALLASETETEDAYRRSIWHLLQTEARLDLARSRLLYGEWLRRQRRRTDARAQLRCAGELFEDMGAEAFAQRARIELEATGERQAPADRLLTSQEAQVARLAADGATNQEIATRLFISHHTVEYHLRKVFRKLDITSRRNLAAALG